MGGLGNVGNLPWTFHLKLALVVVLTGLVGYIHGLQRRARNGDAAAVARMQALGKVMFLIALAIVVLAVLSFD